MVTMADCWHMIYCDNDRHLSMTGHHQSMHLDEYCWSITTYWVIGGEFERSKFRHHHQFSVLYCNVFVPLLRSPKNIPMWFGGTSWLPPHGSQCWSYNSLESITAVLCSHEWVLAHVTMIHHETLQSIMQNYEVTMVWANIDFGCNRASQQNLLENN